MPDIDPAALSRPLMSNAPILPPKSTNAPASGVPKVSKSVVIPTRLDLESIYTALKLKIGEHWGTYKECLSLFLMGEMNQVELSSRIDPFMITPTGETERLHNQLITAIYANVTREMPDQGVASWVSAHDKPTTGAGTKPVTGDAAEQRLKTEIMQLPARDRKRLKGLTQGDFDPHIAMTDFFSEIRRPKMSRLQDADPVAMSAGGLNQTRNWDLEIRKRYTQPLATESGEFPDTSIIDSRMLPICYERGLVKGHVTDAAHFMSVATETFIKEVLSSIFSKTRSNGPGFAGSAGTGGGASWIQTHKYKTQLAREEEAHLRGEVQRDKNGLLPIESKAASERGSLGMADVRLALEMHDCNLGQMPIVVQQIMYGYREGELEAWDDYSWLENHDPGKAYAELMDEDTVMSGIHGINGTNGINDHHEEDINEWGWEGAQYEDQSGLDSLLDSCLAIGS
ncbi:transcriptional regulator of RNA polII, SAGA, subunit-domain-containing protein [Calycina marina]|uniref:Transcriptional regulator of RNA polII, SAGA, subunit-domain-containing protein n=1 Tax=Calycina marina TaxID=1763456 RepID=A0A9P7Z5B4_9HELO|nr:transcriptional regulator of RNA polII, SAGA, subunit-domain-containing protein [Calycina marina]